MRTSRTSPTTSATRRGGGVGSACHRSVSCNGTPPTNGAPPTIVRSSAGLPAATTIGRPVSDSAARVVAMFPRNSESILTSTRCDPESGISPSKARIRARVPSASRRLCKSITAMSAERGAGASWICNDTPLPRKPAAASADPERSSARIKMGSTRTSSSRRSAPFVRVLRNPSYGTCANHAIMPL